MKKLVIMSLLALVSIANAEIIDLNLQRGNASLGETFEVFGRATYYPGCSNCYPGSTKEAKEAANKAARKEAIEVCSSSGANRLELTNPQRSTNYSFYDKIMADSTTGLTNTVVFDARCIFE